MKKSIYFKLTLFVSILSAHSAMALSCSDAIGYVNKGGFTGGCAGAGSSVTCGYFGTGTNYVLTYTLSNGKWACEAFQRNDPAYVVDPVTGKKLMTVDKNDLALQAVTLSSANGEVPPTLPVPSTTLNRPIVGSGSVALPLLNHTVTKPTLPLPSGSLQSPLIKRR